MNASECEVTHEDIARRAYELWQQRGCPVGDGLADWRAAEDELLGDGNFTETDPPTMQHHDPTWWSRMLSKISRAAS